MGHIRLGRLPKSKKWRDVVNLLHGDATVEQVAAAASNAAKDALLTSANDPLFLAVVDLLSRLPLEARGPGYLDALEARGIDEPDSVPGFLAGVAKAIDAEGERLKFRSDLGEIAQAALLSTLSDEFEQSLPSLFEPTPGEIRKAIGQLSSGDRFAGYARRFFAQVVNRTLQYYLSRELSNHVGPGQRFASDAERLAFDRALQQHSYETARIVEAYAGGWYGKTVWHKDGLTSETIRKFAGYAMTKLRRELEQRDDAA